LSWSAAAGRAGSWDFAAIPAAEAERQFPTEADAHRRCNPDNADRVRRSASLKILNQELGKRIKANQQAVEQELAGRER
jgi:hypothetical protein